MSIECLNTLYDNTRIITKCSHELEDLSNSFHHTGNVKMADILDRISQNLMTAQLEIKRAYALEISENLNNIERAAERTVLMTLDAIVKEEGT